MMKWAIYLVMTALAVGGWAMFAKSGGEIRKAEARVEQMREQGEPDEDIAKAAGEVQGQVGSRTFHGILLAFLSAGLVGTVFVVEVLPAIAHKFTHSVYDSSEVIEKDVMHDARAFLARGEYEGAITAFREAMAKDPDNRMPWVEIAKVQKDQLDDPAAAAATLREALESKPWPEDDTVFFLFRLAEVYHEPLGESESAFAVLQQIVDGFPNTRHSANAAHKIQEWSSGAAVDGPASVAESSSLEDEEAEFLAKLREKEAAREENS